MKKSSLSSEIETLKVEQISEKSQSGPGFSPDLGAVEPKVAQNEKKKCVQAFSNTNQSYQKPFRNWVIYIISNSRKFLFFLGIFGFRDIKVLTGAHRLKTPVHLSNLE